MLRILYVALTENDTVRGVERYALELVRALAVRHPRDVCITLLCGAWQRYFEALAAHGVELMIAPVQNSKRSRHLFLWLSMRGLSRNFDLVHYGNLFPVSRANAVPSTMTIHDVAEYALAGKYGRAQRLYRQLIGWRAAHAITAIAADSHFTRNEIVRHLGVPRKRIRVIYPGVDHFRPIADAPASRAGPPYFLYYGVIEQTKGADTAVLGFRQLVEEGVPEVRLLLIGRPGNAYAKIAPMIDGERIVHLGYVEDEGLRPYIAQALAVVFVSRYEGFGLPAVEAYMLNRTVIASKGNAVGEISRGFAFQVDENSVDALAQAMRDVMAGRQPTPTRSREDVLRSFSWAEAAERMLALFRSATSAPVPAPDLR